MKFPFWQLDAFTARRFGGNPAAVVALDRRIAEATMQAIATEANLSDTAFLVPDGEHYSIRWFTPTMEVPLCGHATLASGWVVLNRLEPGRASVQFNSPSGPLRVSRDGERLAMELPINVIARSSGHPGLIATLGRTPLELYESYQWVAVYGSEDEVRALRPDFAAMLKLDVHGVIATAPGKDCDFVSRFFAPNAGINEDPVTGSAHTRTVPYWSARLGKKNLFARQVSARGGELWCELKGERVVLSGHVAPYLEGTIEV